MVASVVVAVAVAGALICAAYEVPRIGRRRRREREVASWRLWAEMLDSYGLAPLARSRRKT